jgi:hypothetical protein
MHFTAFKISTGLYKDSEQEIEDNYEKVAAAKTAMR